ncbi:FMN-binding protein [Ruminococcaceae bacterium OttesenSCG-928-L11]|nr:FMN-binding protein [Ruminococcaceae bacterium OttesenSCG-928-L11]
MKKKMKSRTKIIVAAIALVLVIAATFLINYLVSVQRYQDAITNMIYIHMDATDIPDGTYIGEYDVEYVYAKVQVTVENGLITNLEILEHRHERGAAAERIIDDILEQQIIDVDAISSATNSSQVIKKAVDIALSNAQCEA